MMNLYVSHASTDGYQSEYGCMFVVCASDKAAAEEAVLESYSEWYGGQLSVDSTTPIGTADPSVKPGIVSSFTT